MKKLDSLLITAVLVAIALCYWVWVIKIVKAPVRNYVAGDPDYPKFSQPVKLGE